MNCDEILGVRADTTAQQIAASYRREAMRWHPDGWQALMGAIGQVCADAPKLWQRPKQLREKAKHEIEGVSA